MLRKLVASAVLACATTLALAQSSADINNEVHFTCPVTPEE